MNFAQMLTDSEVLFYSIWKVSPASLWSTWVKSFCSNILYYIVYIFTMENDSFIIIIT